MAAASMTRVVLMLFVASLAVMLAGLLLSVGGSLLGAPPAAAAAGKVETAKRLRSQMGMMMMTKSTGFGGPHEHAKEVLEHPEEEDFVLPWEEARALLRGDKRLVVVVTTTSARPAQRRGLTAMAQAMMLDGAVFWVVVEHEKTVNPELRRFLLGTGLPFAHAARGDPALSPHDLGLDLARRLVTEMGQVGGLGPAPPVLYFAEDDLVIDYRLFDMMRELKRDVGLLAIGFAQAGNYARCVTDEEGQVEHFVSNGGAAAAVDPAAVAVSADVFKRLPEWRLQGGRLDGLVHTLVDSLLDTQPLGKCSTLLVWHGGEPVGLDAPVRGAPAGDKLLAGF